ncbi:MAG: N-acetylmuramoyl-L-alanine amidase [Myxococcales bacterium]|nr:N-acetylmuramoyl-L-alanine amidase [Myxococcales bacterium]
MEQVKAALRLAVLAASLVVSATAWAGPTVVLDPGHGGDKTGTRNADGVFEKDITLRIARYAQAALTSKGVQVVLTRSGDEPMTLAARTAVAKARRAAVFVSIHNNSAPVPERRGVETYILSAHASDEVAEALLHAEESDEPTPVAAESGSDLDFILDDLSRTAAHEDSARLARHIQDHLGKVSAAGPSRGLRQAPFQLLKEAEMAAVLVEVGYLSHPVQGRALAGARGQKAAGDALARGILSYLRASGAK